MASHTAGPLHAVVRIGSVPRPPAFKRVHADRSWSRVLEAGDGAPIVLVASPLVFASTYLPVVRELATFSRVSVVELPGSGGSAPTKEPWSFAEQAAFLRKLLAAMDLEQATIIGHSNGGASVLLAATAPHPAIGRIILADTVGSVPRSVARVLAARARDSFRELRLNGFAMPHVLANALRHPRSFLAQVRESARADLAEAAADVCVPALLAWGRDDATTPASGAIRLASRMTDAHVHIDDGSHDWILTDPARFARVVLRFAMGRPSEEP